MKKPIPRLATPTDLKSNATKDIAGALNALLADIFTLYMKTKNFHWHMSGPHFRDYHLMLDEHADQIFAMTDANRLLASALFSGQAGHCKRWPAPLSTQFLDITLAGRKRRLLLSRLVARDNPPSNLFDPEYA